MRTRLATAAMVVAGTAALALPGVAFAGGFATVGLSSLPDGTAPGRPWHVTLTILQHGRTPLSDLKPQITIRSGDVTRTFAALAAARAGTYRADVVFPKAGRWRYSIADGFSLTHTFASVAIGSSSAITVAGAESGASVPTMTSPSPAAGVASARGKGDGTGANAPAALAAALVAGLLAALGTALALRRRPAAGEPATSGAR